MKHGKSLFVVAVAFLSLLIFSGYAPKQVQAGGPGARPWGGFQSSGKEASRGTPSGGKSFDDTGRNFDEGKQSGKEISGPGDPGKQMGGNKAKRTAGDYLRQNGRLASTARSLLPQGTNLQDASNGFDHVGQFFAAAHASNNLGIPFEQLKGKIAGPSNMKLGQAIYELRPNVNAMEEAIRANELALTDLEAAFSN